LVSAHVIQVQSRILKSTQIHGPASSIRWAYQGLQDILLAFAVLELAFDLLIS
jgi:hypothetical protein